LKKITFGTKGWVLFTDNKGVEEAVVRALTIRGHSNVSVEDVSGESIWGGTKQTSVVSGTLGGSGSPYLMYLTRDTEADEKVREAMSLTVPQADMTSVLMSKPE
jgi:hypothetical protein